MKSAAIRLTAVVIAAATLAAPAFAQGSKFVGSWGCQMTYTELDQFGNRTSGFVRNYMLQVNDNGTYQAQGSQPGIYGNQQFVSQGQWQVDQAGGFIANGPEQMQGALIQMKFVMVANLMPNGELSYRYDMPDPSNRYVMNRSLYQCSRQG